MRKTPIILQELRKRIYMKAKADQAHRFWGLYVHICKIETLQESYLLTKKNNGAPGIDGVTFGQIEEKGVDKFLQDIQSELIEDTYLPTGNRIKDISKGNGKTRKLGIPTIKDRVVQGALKLISEPIFEADFQQGSYGYRPKRTAHQAIERVAQAIVEVKTRVIDLDLKSYFDSVSHDKLLNKVALRIQDDKVMRLLKLILKASGKCGVPQGGVISPLLSNIFLNEVDKMLEKAKETTCNGRYTYIEYARYADDIVILIDGYKKHDWLWKGVNKRLREELLKIGVQINEEKTKQIDLTKGESFNFLGFTFRRVRTRNARWGVHYQPKMEARTKLLDKLKEIFKRYESQPIERVTHLINPILRGWVSYFRIGNSSRTFGYVKDWTQKKVRRHLMKARRLKGFGWERWNREWIYKVIKLFNDYKIHRPKVNPA